MMTGQTPLDMIIHPSSIHGFRQISLTTTMKLLQMSPLLLSNYQVWKNPSEILHTAPAVPLSTVDICVDLYPSSGEDGDCTIIGENAISNEAQSATGSDCLGDSTTSDKKKKRVRKRSVQHIERNTYRRACTILKRFAHYDVNSLSPLEEKMLARHRRTVARYEAKYPNSVPSNGTPSQATAPSPTCANNTIMEPIASTSKSVNTVSANCFTPIVPPFSKPLVNNTFVPCTIERG